MQTLPNHRRHPSGADSPPDAQPVAGSFSPPLLLNPKHRGRHGEGGGTRCNPPCAGAELVRSPGERCRCHPPAGMLPREQGRRWWLLPCFFLTSCSRPSLAPESQRAQRGLAAMSIPGSWSSRASPASPELKGQHRDGGTSPSLLRHPPLIPSPSRRSRRPRAVSHLRSPFPG